MIAGLDAGLTKSGLALLENDFNVISLNLIRVEPSAAKRLLDIELAIDRILSEQDNVEIFIEGYAYGAKYQRESLAELGGVLRRYFYINALTYWVIPPLLLKQYVTGTSKANKNYMKKCTKEKWGESFKSDDVCDAYGLARLGVSVNKTLSSTELPTDPFEAKVVAEITNHVENYLGANTARRTKKKR